jgi:GT2 family glycosyltransferase
MKDLKIVSSKDPKFSLYFSICKKKILFFLKKLYLILPNFITHNRLVVKIGMSLISRLKEPVGDPGAYCCEFKEGVKKIYPKNQVLPKFIPNFGKVDIIIPVYNGFNYLTPLFSSIFANTDVSYNLIIINDASSDIRVKIFLDNIARERSNIKVIHNEQNCGFVKTVNSAFSLAKNHVVIMNTDVILPKNWLSRLIYPLIQYDNVASATPLTNSGTICSFPVIFEDNDLAFSLSLEEINAECQRIKLEKDIFIETPTGVGFCMAISQQALRMVGKFNEKEFGRGYGEEIDWCLRAKNSGLINVIATNLYVYHQHGGSFAPNSKKKLMLDHGKIIARKYPNFTSLIRETAENPEYKKIRFCLLLLLVFKKAQQRYLVFDDNLNIKNSEGNAVLLVREHSGKCKITLFFLEYKIDFISHNIEDFFLILDYVNMDKIIVNSSSKQLLEAVTAAKKKYGFEYET